MTTGLLNKQNQYMAPTTHLVALLTTFCLQENSCTRSQTLQSIETSSQPSYDDNPLVDPMCEKKFSGVSYGGYGYMFIWFCPKHGHTYGFHLINKAEGCRDPFCSLYKFLEHMPKHIFL